MSIKLPRLPIGWQSTPELFERYWDRAMVQIETSINGILDATAAAAAANAAATSASTAAATATTAAATAQTSATAANTAATTANTVATAVTAQSNIASSYVTGCTVTATDAGASATVSISAHTRIYADGTSVAVNAGSVTALTYSTKFYVYYDQVSRLGGAVTYAVTTSPTTAAQLGSRHVVGSVTTPVATGVLTTGFIVLPPGTGTLP